MSRKKIIALIIVFILTLTGGYFYAFITRDAALYGEEYKGMQTVDVKVLNPEEEFSFDFHCDKENLTGFKLVLSVPEGKGSLTYSLVDKKSGKTEGNFERKLSRIKNDKNNEFEVEEIKDSAGHDYTATIRLSADAAKLSVKGYSEEKVPAASYYYGVWDVVTMIVFVLFITYMVAFILVLRKIFRK